MIGFRQPKWQPVPEEIAASEWTSSSKGSI
jgi:hypothetical protein